MKIVIVSDSHGEREALERIYRDEPSADLYLHAGDVCMPSDFAFPFIPVRGNCDYSPDLPERLRFETPYGGLLLMHGHTLSAVTDSFMRRNDCRILVIGHTHIHLAKSFTGLDNEIYYVFNPGSVSRPRDGETGSYLVLEVTDKEVNSRLVRLPY